MQLHIQGLESLPRLLEFSVSERQHWLLSLKLLSELTLPEAATRDRQVFFRNTDFELILVRWGVGSRTEIHSHGQSECSFVVLAGEITETTFRTQDLSLVGTKLHRAGSVSSIVSDELSHSISSAQGALSVHLYAKPLALFSQFNGLVWETREGAKL